MSIITHTSFEETKLFIVYFGHLIVFTFSNNVGFESKGWWSFPVSPNPMHMYFWSEQKQMFPVGLGIIKQRLGVGALWDCQDHSRVENSVDLVPS